MSLALTLIITLTPTPALTLALILTPTLTPTLTLALILTLTQPYADRKGHKRPIQAGPGP